MTTPPSPEPTAGHGSIEGLDALPPDDQAAIGKTCGTLARGFATHSADGLQEIYAEDADWINAFGTVKKGAQEIAAYLKILFANANFAAGTMPEPPTISLRKVTDEVVVVTINQHIRGQLLTSGEAIQLRDNHSLHILHKETDGRWLIVSEMFMDARQDATMEAQS
jgi:uncharacterized protein (TIGR02246 family)